MKPVASPLRIIDFAMTRMDFEMVYSAGSDDQVAALFNKYPVDIDFSVDRSNGYLRAFIKAAINSARELPGYYIQAEAACIFEFDKSKPLSGDQKESMEGFSTIYIALNSLRGLISSFTANAPMGRYILPSIDLNDLIEKKKASRSRKSVVRKPGAKKSVRAVGNKKKILAKQGKKKI